jgi:transcriptional regulator with XRE-family HTH domain
MSNVVRAIGCAFLWVGRTISTILGIFWILILLSVTIWLSVGSLAAIQVRGQLGESERELSFNDVQRAYDKYQERKNLIDRQLHSFDPIAEAFREVDGAVEAIFQQSQRTDGDEAPAIPEDFDPVAFSNTDQFQARLRTCVPAPGPDSGAVDATTPALARVDAEAPATEPASATPDTAATVDCQLFVAYDQLLARAFATDPEDSAKSYEIALLNAQKQTEELQRQETLFKHFSAYEFFVFIGAPKLLLIPPEVLVLFATMAMGVLGSAISMTWLFIRQDGTMTVRRFMTLPVIGAVSAFVVFIFVRAGQLTLTTGEAEDSLNPFVLAFIGVISGMLSERAYNRITEVGTSFFNVDDGQPRWGCRLRDTMRAAGVSEAELARYLTVTEEEAGRIVNETTTATFEQQRLIAACLRRTVRELFTDVPPDAPSTVAAAPAVVVPSLVGLDRAAAESGLEMAGLALGEVSAVQDASAAPGVVLSQRPAADARVARGAPVDLTVAEGAAETAEPAEPPPA